MDSGKKINFECGKSTLNRTQRNFREWENREKVRRKKASRKRIF